MTDDQVPHDSDADPAPRPPEAGGGADADPAPPWADPARPRGLDAYFAPGGEDDAPPARVADERRMLRLLVLMVALLIGIPTLLTLIAVAGQLVATRSGG